jgi:hypothetical protein
MQPVTTTWTSLSKLRFFNSDARASWTARQPELKQPAPPQTNT